MNPERATSKVAVGEDEISNSRRNAITRAIEIVSPAVVGINVTELRERRVDPFFRLFFGEQIYRTQSVGSGFIISEDGYIITNDHVAGRAQEISVTMTDGSKHPAKLIGTDPVTDLALIKIDTDRSLPYLKLGNSDDVIVGEWSIAFGNPFGLFSASAKPTVTVGVISATQVFLEQREGRVYRNMVQTDAAINQGNSGGPLVNSDGEVIGINTVIYTPNEGNIGLGFAVPVNRAKLIVRYLREDGEVDRGFSPGFRVQLVNEAIAQAYNLEKVEGVIVTQILDPKGVARKSGLEVADIILSANGEPVFSIQMLDSLIRYAIRGESIRLEVLRKNRIRTIDLVLE
ncbi:MAG: trypsin-like peptidase domain-containing protein [Bacteroidetes bacterium]|nr:trypsin-like peptidase domain-containing protein [Bacteroidota bacterium]